MRVLAESKDLGSDQSHVHTDLLTTRAISPGFQERRCVENRVLGRFGFSKHMYTQLFSTHRVQQN